MPNTRFNNYRIYYSFLNALAKDLTKYYYKKLDKPFNVINKGKKKKYDPVTQADREFEKFIRKRKRCDQNVLWYCGSTLRGMI